MGDGGYVAKGGLHLCTHCFSVQEVVRLMNVFMVRYELICTLHQNKAGQYQIYISKKSMGKLRSIVRQHMEPSMLYKIHL